MPKQLRVAVVTISTRCSTGLANDESGPLLCELISGRNWSVAKTVIVGDDKSAIETALRDLISPEIDVVLTTGGTGISSDDVTPEATRAVLDRELPGLVSGMFLASFQETPFAMLSRAVAGVSQKTVIINMPGSVRAVSTCFKTVAPVLEHVVALINGNTDEIGSTHAQLAREDSSPLLHQHAYRHRVHSHNHGHKHLHQQHSCEEKHEHSNPGQRPFRRVNSEDRPRESTYPTVSVEKALEIVLSNCESSQVEEIPLPCCSNGKNCQNISLRSRYLAKDLFSLCPVPSFRASVKDGYAVRSEDGAGKRLVIGRSDAGFCYGGENLQPGYAVAINTGAKVPESADAVVQIEDTRFISGKSLPFGDVKIPILETIELTKAPQPGQDIRPIGCDLEIGDKLASKGDRLTPAVIALLISGGYSAVPVVKLPVVAILSTGSELVSTPVTQSDGLVRDSNRPMLIELLASHGFPTVDCGIARDTVEDHRTRFHAALSVPGVRVILTTGGVSMGDCDFVKDVLINDFDAKIHFGRVFVKPGKPTVFATLSVRDSEPILVFSLPGNPVSCLVTAHLFLLPALRQLAGCSTNSLMPTMFAKLEHDFDLDPRPEYHRVVLRSDPSSGTLLASSTGAKQASSRIASASSSNSPGLMLGLLALPPSSNDRITISAGTVLPVHPLIPF